MSELVPTVQASSLREGLVDYLTTAFSLTDPRAAEALRSFLESPRSGIFRGPFLRLRLPFQSADDEWRQHLGEWAQDFTPYGHQAAAFTRLSSLGEGVTPRPTLVTTGTGSGKTEAFLYPILDHVIRARRAGETGTKALLLYPMNALANDQAQRLARLISSTPALAGVTAALYTGEDTSGRTTVTADGLITERSVIRQSAPDILLTNYKMLDQLLLRHDDAGIWEQSAHSLRYLVLDEFHTYDGAQGTDVAMLLRRFGLRLKSLNASTSSNPLGDVTPIATSATLGDRGDPEAMMTFAATVFGEGFGEDAVVTESRLDFDEWQGRAASRISEAGFRPEPLTVERVQTLAALATDALDSHERSIAVAKVLFSRADGQSDDTAFAEDSDLLLDFSKAHPVFRRLIGLCSDSAQSLDALATVILPGEAADLTAHRGAALQSIIAFLSHVRAISGRAALSIDLHLWIRELTRIDRTAAGTVSFRWSDDGAREVHDDGADLDGLSAPAFPAIYCRHCGRSGWGVTLASVGEDLHADDSRIRAKHAVHEGRFRALLTADNEADTAILDKNLDEAIRGGLRFFAVRDRRLLDTMPGDDDEDLAEGGILPVLTLVGPEADSNSSDDLCPACEQPDGIRFLGSAISTLLSVSISTIFGTESLDSREKKALVFTDSVQDAAHRAGFVQSRSHTLSLRAALGRAVATGGSSLPELVEAALNQAGDDTFDRYRLMDPVYADREGFSEFWRARTQRAVPSSIRRRIRERLTFDAALEFGLQSHVGRTLERTGAASARVEAGTAQKLAALARPLLEGFERGAELGETGEVTDEALVAWVRGVLERMRTRGAIQHRWLNQYLNSDGNRWHINGGRLRSEGMPAFPARRPTPAFPRVGGAAPTRGRDTLDPVTPAQSWYATWTHKVLRVSPSDGGRLATRLFARLASVGVIESIRSESGSDIYMLSPDSILVTPVSEAELADIRLRCDVCRDPVHGDAETIAELNGAPCTVVRCPGKLAIAPVSDNYYRSLYQSRDMRRVVAREHTSLLEARTRLEYENGFKNDADDPGAPNVLVATPTLEMGIDIGDLSTVMLSSLPRRVASFLQRVGRAGRLTGNALDLAFVSGRGENLPLLSDPLRMINGAVRPPATYLNAEEILRRQYVASIADRFAADPARPHPRRASAAIASSEPCTYLGDLIDTSEEHADVLLGAFLGTFDALSEDSELRLRSWATPTDGPGTSALAQHLHLASASWRTTVEALERRRKQIEESLPDLELRAKLEQAEDEDKRAHRTALGALKLTQRQLKDLRGEHWISVLESYAILPNYTLLDDTVTLDVTLNWIDPDTDEYHSDGVTYSRGASVALRELAPGATFYAHGAAVRVDAIDLGHEAEAVHPWAYCAACGYAVALDTEGAPRVLSSCPRCGDRAIADTRQHIDTVELERVSAEVRRDEALITDSSDERTRERFAVVVAADIDRREMQAEWYAERIGFGATLLRAVDIRWLNLGRSGGSGTARTIASVEESAPLFRVCAQCGKLDRAIGSNRREEHRPWCPLRTTVDEDQRTVALSRTLRTQAVALRLPPSTTIGDSFAVPSLAAAVLLGLREQLGGAPDHIQIVATVMPEGDAVIDTLLVHDTVPGGTGYLADLADSDRVWDLLLRAYRIVRDCDCKLDGRLACHDCLLPFASGSADVVSRETAVRLLRQILVGSSEDAPTDESTWSVTSVAPDSHDPESVLEQEFRAAFVKRVTATGAVVREVPGPTGNRIDVTGASGGIRWSLIPQKGNGSSRPDFTLQSQKTTIPDVLIFTDGHRYHAHRANNRLADDAEKREMARLNGDVVIGVTWDDLRSEPVAPSWYSDQQALRMMNAYGYNRELLSVLAASPLDFLLWWMTAPDQRAWSTIADAVPALLRGAQSVDEGVSASTLASEVANGTSAPGDVRALRYQNGLLSVGVVAPAPNRMRISLVLDDSADAVSRDDHAAAWREWLRLSNLLALRTFAAEITTTSLLAERSPRSQGTPVVADFEFPAGWQLIVDELPEEHKPFARELAEAGASAPVVGMETDEGAPVDFAWPSQRVAASPDWDSETRAELEAAGWAVFDTNVDDICTALVRTEG